MKFNNKSYKTETVREIITEMKGNKYGDKPIINGGYPIFNTCGHTTIDMSNIENNDMHTLSIKTGENQYITLCVMPMMNGNYTNIDLKMYAPDDFRNHAIHFSSRGVGMEDIKVPDFNLMALITEKSKK